MKTFFTTLLMALSMNVMANQPVYLSIAGESNGMPGQTIPTANHEECEKLMIKLAKEDSQNFYLSCSIVPQLR